MTINTSVLAYFRLMRPANIITAMADILCGFAISGSVLVIADFAEPVFSLSNTSSLVFLLLSTIGLYGGGVVFNDVFDSNLDKIERPERPIPSGSATLQGAIMLGSFLFLSGIMFAFLSSVISGFIAIIITILALVYDSLSKHHSFWGPLNMGSCRGANLLLGISAVPLAVKDFWYMAAIPIMYIFAITLISQGEVHGGSKKTLYKAVGLYALVILTILNLGLWLHYQVLYAIPFLLLFAFLIFPPLFKSIDNPLGSNIMKAVKMGVISLIVMDAAIAAGFAGWVYGLLVLLLLPISRYLAKIFAVT